MSPKQHLVVIGLVILAGACNRAEAKTRTVGDSLRPFIVKNCETGQQYCQVCAYSGKPTLMAVGELGDVEFEQDLTRIQKLLDAKKGKGLAAFAVVGKVDGSKLLDVADEEKTVAALKALKTKLGLSFPVVILASKLSDSEKKNYTKFSEAYEVKGSRTIMFAAADSKLVYVDKIEPAKRDQQFKSLEEAIDKTL